MILVWFYFVIGLLVGSGGFILILINGLGLLGMCISEGLDCFVIRICFRFVMNFEEFFNLWDYRYVFGIMWDKCCLGEKFVLVCEM